MRSRRSVRCFKREKPSRQMIEDLIDIAITAPSASNKQPWRFFVTDSSETIDCLAVAVQVAVDRIVEHIDKGFIETFRAYGDYFVRFRTAPVVIVPVFREIVVLSNLVNKDISSNDLACIRTMEFNSGLASTALAIQNLLLYAHEIGLGTSCMTGPLVALDSLKTILRIPDGWHIAAVIAVGYPDEEPKSPGRKSATAVLRWVNQPTEE
ncbi:MAG: nitroreductase family protein [Acidobacteriota bacterium]